MREFEPDEFIAEVKKRQPKSAGGLTQAALKVLPQVYAEYVPVLRKRQKEALGIEHRISTLVMTAYQLTPEEIALLWRTAPLACPLGRGRTRGAELLLELHVAIPQRYGVLHCTVRRVRCDVFEQALRALRERFQTGVMCGAANVPVQRCVETSEVLRVQRCCAVFACVVDRRPHSLNCQR